MGLANPSPSRATSEVVTLALTLTTSEVAWSMLSRVIRVLFCRSWFGLG